MNLRSGQRTIIYYTGGDDVSRRTATYKNVRKYLHNIIIIIIRILYENA